MPKWLILTSGHIATLFGTSKNVTKYRAPPPWFITEIFQKYVIWTCFRKCFVCKYGYLEFWKMDAIRTNAVENTSGWLFWTCFWKYKQFGRDTQNKSENETNSSKYKNYKNGYVLLFSSKGIHSTPQHTDSRPCTRPGKGKECKGAW